MCNLNLDSFSRAERAGEWWQAGRLWAVVCEVTFRAEGGADVGPAAERALDAIAKFMETARSEVLDDVHDVQLRVLMCLGLTLNVPLLAARATEVNSILASSAAVRDRVSAATVRAVTVFPAIFAGDGASFGSAFIACVPARVKCSSNTPSNSPPLSLDTYCGQLGIIS